MKSLLHLGLLLLFIFPLHAQTKQIKRPKKAVGISTVDRFVDSSFDLYEKVYTYDGYAETGRELEDDDLDVLEDALDDAQELLTEAPDVLSSLEGQNVLKQGKATLQLNKSKKALKYCIKTIPTLLRSRDNDTGSNEEPSETEDDTDTSSDSSSDTDSQSSGTSSGEASGNRVFKINSKFDFVPGDQLLFFDDYSNDFIGDFPSKWNTNGSGEVVTINDDQQRWMLLVPGSGTYYIPNMTDLPEEYTIEFDMLVNGIDKKTSSNAKLNVDLDDNNTFRRGSSYANANIPLVQFIKDGIYINNSEGISNEVSADIRTAVLNKPHISIAVNKQRYRLWINDIKYVDVPKFISSQQRPTQLKFNLYGTKDGKEQVLISNLKIAKGGIDLRRTLMNTGSVSTNGILFDSGSANIQPQSYGILRQISQVLQQDSNMKLLIVGHTDSDGDDDSNLTLSRKRAEAVKAALEKTYGVSESRLSTDGKGSSEPVADNDSTDGKARNRRVVFIKQ